MSIIFKLKSSRQTYQAPIEGSYVDAITAREVIAQKLNIPENEIDLYWSGQRVTSSNLQIPAFSEIEVERKMSTNKGKPQSIFTKEARAKESEVKHFVGMAKTVQMNISTSSYGAAGQSAASEMHSGGNSSSAMSTIGGVNVSEEQRIMQLQDAVGQQINGEQHGGFQQRGGWNRRPQRDPNAEKRPPPPWFVCHNCMKKGHWIEDCPEPQNADGRKALSNPVGIAESKLRPVDHAKVLSGECKSHFVKNGIFVQRIEEKGSFGGVPGGDHDALVNEAILDKIMQEKRAVEIKQLEEKESRKNETVHRNENNNDDDDDEKQNISNGSNNNPREGEAEEKGKNAGGSPSPPPVESTSSKQPQKTINPFMCYICKKLVDNAVRPPCCQSEVVLCSACLDHHVEEVGPQCPKCEEPILLDDIIEDTELRKIVAMEKQKMRKRKRADAM